MDKETILIFHQACSRLIPLNDYIFYALQFKAGFKLHHNSKLHSNAILDFKLHVPGWVAKSVGHLTRKSGVLGSIPGVATYFRFSFRFFKKGSCQLLALGRVAQWVGHLTRKSGVLGSIPSLATYFRFSFSFFKKGSCQVLAKVCA